MDSEGTQCNHKARQVPGPREGQSPCVPALLTLLLILFHFLNINIEALLSSKGRVAQTSRHGCTAHPSQVDDRLLIPRAHGSTPRPGRNTDGQGWGSGHDH
jgi:hypothetical protein